MEDTTILDNLPTDLREADWNQVEGKFWPIFLARQEAEYSDSVRRYEMALTEAKVELGTLNGQREELTKMRDVLARQLNQVERDLAYIVLEYNRKVHERLGLEKEYGQAKQQWLQERESHINVLVRYFEDIRTAEDGAADEATDASGGSTGGREATGSVSTEMNGAEYWNDLPSRPSPSAPAITARQVVAKTPIAPLVPSTAPRSLPQDLVFLTNLVDADNQVIGPIYKTEPWNQWVKAILNVPVKRNVKVRRGRKFTPDHLAAIYDHTEAKGVKWLSCMIQATGEIQGKRCLSCNKNQGAFDDCIIIGTPLFQKCGNCEWNRQGCHGAAPVADKGSASAEAAQNNRVPRKVSNELEANRASGDRDAPSQEDGDLKRDTREDSSREPPNQAEQETASATTLPNDATNPPVQQRRGLPSSRPPLHQTEQLSAPRERPGLKAYPSIAGFTPVNITPTRPPSQEFEAPTPSSFRSSPGPSESIPPLRKITKDTLVLKHKDGVYTEPEILKGVPLEKISPSHPYWEPDWPNIVELVEPMLAHFEDKHNVALEKKGTEEDHSTKRFQLGRQVGRGQVILKFLDEGEISPFQLLGKKYTSYGKGSITSYDTLFRMCHALRELHYFKAKGKIDVEPVEWMRHRLHELWEVLGSAFKLAEAIRGFYHDPKMTQLREECGKKNIGRPRGSKAHRQSDYTPADDTPADAHSAQKRERLSSGSSSHNGGDHDQSSTRFMSESGHNSAVPKASSPVRGPLTKRARSLSPSIRPYRVTVDDTTEFIDREVSSNTPLTQNDFRIDQVKSQRYTSSA